MSYIRENQFVRSDTGVYMYLLLNVHLRVTDIDYVRYIQELIPLHK